MTFNQLNDALQKAVARENYTEPTPIQAQAIPPVLQGKDVLGIAQTGTGKTAAFTLPLLDRLAKDTHRSGTPRALILAPTRELAAQIGASIETYGRFLKIWHVVIFGGVGQHPQVQKLRKGVDIIVATPGRLLDLMGQGHVKLNDIEVFILDEADRMLDMGFIHDIKKVVKVLPKKRQTLFFSATMPTQVEKLARQILSDPVRIEIAPQSTTVERIDQKVLFIDKKDKDELLKELLQREHLTKTLVFTRTKHGANKVVKKLSKSGIRSSAIHGNKSQTARTNALKNFSEDRIQVLVATDIAARGIDVDDISHVINYDLPTEAETYVHRIGRTARAGAEGTAYSFCSAPERDQLRAIEKVTGQKIAVMEHDWHSEQAKNATGKDARPAPKKQRQRRGKGRSYDPNKNRYRIKRPKGR